MAGIVSSFVDADFGGCSPLWMFCPSILSPTSRQRTSHGWRFKLTALEALPVIVGQK
jgi:hypothetical protein